MTVCSPEVQDLLNATCQPGNYTNTSVWRSCIGNVVYIWGLSQSSAWAPAQAPRADIRALRAAPKCRLNASCIHSRGLRKAPRNSLALWGLLCSRPKCHSKRASSWAQDLSQWSSQFDHYILVIFEMSFSVALVLLGAPWFHREWMVSQSVLQAPYHSEMSAWMKISVTWTFS